LDKKGLASFKNQESVLWNLIKSFGFNFDQCRQITADLFGQSGRRFNSTEFELVIDRDHLIISKNQSELTETLIESNQTEVSLGKYKMKIERKENADFKSDPSIAFLDASKLSFPISWRKWEPGDFFYPLGMIHKKKVSDFLIDQKISVADKEMVTVLESGNEIVWVVGLRIDERFKIIDSTTNAVVCRLSTAD
jgi:tRNA(Ile)-lysidine synthase